MFEKNGLGIALLLGIALIVAGIVCGPEGAVVWGMARLIPGAEKIQLVLGIIICVITIRGLLRGDGKPPKYTDKDVEEAKAELERLYWLEHGTMPVPPEEATPPGPAAKESPPPQDTTDPAR